MNIVFIVPYVPTPIRTRPFNLLRTLARRGHAVTLATLWENEAERAALKDFENQGICVLAARLTKPRSAWNSLRALATAVPLQSVYCWQPELCERMQKVVGSRPRPFDVIHIEHLRGARYGLQPPVSSLQSPMVWDSVDCISYLFEQAKHYSRSPFSRLVTGFELPRTKKYERWLVSQFDRVLVTSPIDAAALEALVSGSNPSESRQLQRTGPYHPISNRQPLGGVSQSPISVVPNGVDLDYFSPSDAARESATIVFSGKMSYHANVAAALHLVHDIMPHVWTKRPDVHVQIVGQDPPSRVKGLATRDTPRVTVTGRVPDLRPYLQRATLAVAPMSYGAGIQNKVLEAMACATPVIATSQAVSALEALPGEHLLVADEPSVFALQILRLLDDRVLQSRIGPAGRRYVEQYHDWNTVVARLENVYRETIG